MKPDIDDIAALCGMSVTRLDETTSTNDAARAEGLGYGCIVTAERQTAGRGQRGNSWESRAGENLTFSMVLEPSFLPPHDQFLLSEVVSLAITDMLGAYGVSACIKWPNDIYIENRKVAGILIENDIKGPVLYRSIVGIGLNVNQTLFDPSLPNPVSMKTVAGREFDRDEVLGSFITAFSVRYRSLKGGERGVIRQDYHVRLYRRNRPSVFSLPDGSTFTGIIRNVGDSGELMIAHPDGRVEGYFFKETELVGTDLTDLTGRHAL